MQPMLLWKRVVGYHGLAVSHEDLGGFGIELLVSKRLFDKVSAHECPAEAAADMRSD
jgi:hypothetical protein